jgi:hypothetical protein
MVELSEKPSVVEEKVYKVLIGIPLKGHTPPTSYHDRMLMFKHLGHREEQDYQEKKPVRYTFSIGCVGEILVPYAREVLAKQAVDTDCDYLFMIDDDMLAPPDLFFKLAANDKDICAALAFTRNPDHKPVMYQVTQGRDPLGYEFYQNMFVINYPRDTLVECDAVGFGAVLIKVDTLRKVKVPRFMGLVGTGEDIAFCHKAKKAGCEVWMDTRIKLGHLGDAKIVTEEYADNWLKLSPDERDKFYGRYSYPSLSLTGEERQCQQ